MQIKKRSFPMYIFLNCITLGIYGFVVSMQIGKEINALCKGDGEEPRFGYAGAVAIRGISPLLGLIAGLIVGLYGSNSLNMGVLRYYYGAGGMNTVIVLMSMLLFSIIFTLIGSIFSGIYLKFWWYKQSGRLQLNAQRYGLKVKESGTDNFMFHTIAEILFLPASIILIGLSLLIPILIVWLITLAGSLGAVVFALILALVFVLPILFFGMELTAGSNIAMYFVIKNLNRFADVYRNGATQFDPMGYEYYPSHENKYPNFLPNLVNGNLNVGVGADGGEIEEPIDEPQTGFISTGALIGVNGSCAGYNFTLNSGEEIIIGKDAKVSSVIIDPAYKEISRKHLGVCYDVIRDQYRVVDYSSNGTWANGEKLVPGKETYLTHGSILKLANDKNTFRLA